VASLPEREIMSFGIMMSGHLNNLIYSCAGGRRLFRRLAERSIRYETKLEVCYTHLCMIVQGAHSLNHGGVQQGCMGRAHREM
jgi:hypothetical protein